MEDSMADVPGHGASRAGQAANRALALLSLLYPILVSLLYVGKIQDRMTYAYSHLFLNYSHGFARRSLYGTLFQSEPFISERLALFVGGAEVLAAVLLTYLIFARYFISSYRDTLLFCFLFGGCGLLPHLGLIYGYLDVLLYSLLLITVLIIYRFKDRLALQLVLVSAITVLALLIHEAYLLMFYPVVLVLLLLETRPTRPYRLALLLHCAFVACSFLLIIRNGNSNIDPDTYFRLAKARTNIPILDLVFGQLQSNLRVQVTTSMHFYLKPATMALIAVSIAIASPYLLVLGNLLFATCTKIRTQPRWVIRLIPVFLFTPLLLVLVGFDLMRWLSCACTNAAVLVTCQFCFAPNKVDIKRALRGITARGWFLAGLLAMIVIGPFGIVLGSRIFEKLFSCGSWWFCV